MDKQSPYQLLASIDSSIQKASQGESLPNFQHQGLCFGSSNQWFVIALDSVSEIMGPTAIVELPRVKSWLKGAIQLRGQPILINDLGDYLLKTPTVLDHQNRIVVVDYNHEKIGFLLRNIVRFVRFKTSPVSSGHPLALKHSFVKDIQTDDKKDLVLIDLKQLCQDPQFLNTRRVDINSRDSDELI